MGGNDQPGIGGKVNLGFSATGGAEPAEISLITSLVAPDGRVITTYAPLKYPYSKHGRVNRPTGVDIPCSAAPGVGYYISGRLAS